ncbi:FMN-binding protein [Micromonospora citrea]|uniref:FMN-binding protein n=1 Tax=Micromonospora citrea TaxID=47855 RepID=UPI003C31BC89
MRRALLAITGLAAGTTALVVLKGSPGASQVAAVEQPPVVPAGSDPAALPEAASTPTASGPARSTRPTPGARQSPTGRAGADAPRPAAPAPTSSAPRPTLRTVSGPQVTYEYGTLSVQITLSGTRIVNATGIGLPQSGQSGQRSDDVQATYSGTSGEVVRRQSAGLDTVSDATATSDAYKKSLQAAIDRAR